MKKIKYARFFQPVGLPGGNKTVNSDILSISATNTVYDIEIEQPFIKITHKTTGDTLFASFYNLQYLRFEDEPAEASEPIGKASTPASDKKPRKQNSVAADVVPGTESVPS